MLTFFLTLLILGSTSHEQNGQHKSDDKGFSPNMNLFP
jgi:hypothetical protein